MPRTKGYYRFTKDYPGETDEYGYRDNETIRKKPLPNRGRLAVYFAIIFCFILGFVATSVALQISNLEPETTTRAETVTEEPQSEDLPPPDFTTEPETETEGFTVPQTHTQPETGTAQETTAGPRDTQETTEPGGDA
ncbi:MAG: hypothetical protein LBS36_06315 [Oscillospiraceae bacterium]|nr:hypothetical protein [Oscillospiraceae bacterium]